MILVDRLLFNKEYRIKIDEYNKEHMLILGHQPVLVSRLASCS